MCVKLRMLACLVGDQYNVIRFSIKLLIYVGQGNSTRLITIFISVQSLFSLHPSLMSKFKFVFVFNTTNYKNSSTFSTVMLFIAKNINWEKTEHIPQDYV